MSRVRGRFFGSTDVPIRSPGTSDAVAAPRASTEQTLARTTPGSITQVGLDDAQNDAVNLAGDVKGKMVDFATSARFQRYWRELAREIHDDHPELDGDIVGVRATERLLFEFRYDDGTTIIDRFLQQPRLTDREREMAVGFLGGIEGIFEVTEDTPRGATAFEVRCCLSDLEHVVAPTEPTGIPTIPSGSFVVGRLNPVAGTDLWTPSGDMDILPASQREAIAESVMTMAMQSPWLTHRNPEKRKAAADRVAEAHQRFVDRHGGDRILIHGKDVPDAFAEALVPVEGIDPAQVASGQAVARRTFEGTELLDCDDVLMYSHPVAGFGFYTYFTQVARALEHGSDADPEDLDIVRGYLDADSVPTWLLRQIIEENLPTSEAALALALNRPGFDWGRDGGDLLASLPGEAEPTLTLAIVPTMCTPSP